MDSLKRVSLIATVIALAIVGLHKLVFSQHEIDAGVIGMAGILGGLLALGIEWVLKRRDAKPPAAGNATGTSEGQR